MEVEPSSAKLVSGWSPDRALKDRLAATLALHLPAGDVRYLHGRVFLVLTSASVETIRGWLSPCLTDGDALFVVEFERWAAAGQTSAAGWLPASPAGDGP